MRISAPITVSALVVAGLVATGSTSDPTSSTGAPTAPEALLASSTNPAGASEASGAASDTGLSKTVGLLPVTQEAPRKLRAMTPLDGSAPFAGRVPLQEISLPLVGGALGIPEIVLAAYRNAELALESSTPDCGLSWSLLAGIGRIESGHASGGRTDAAGTTVTPIYGPALDGTLPGNEIIKAASGGYVRAVGPMQFLPGTWTQYAADGNGDGVADPNNVFDAALAAGKYLCSGGLNLRDQAQELRAILRYNNSTAYAANVLSWAAAYRTGGAPTQVNISPELIPPGRAPIPMPDMTAVTYTNPTPGSTVPAAPQTSTTTTTPTPTEVMITIPGLPPIPCGIFCPPPPKPLNPCEPVVIPAPMPQPGEPAEAAVVPGAPAQSFGAGTVAPKDPAHPEQPVMPVCTPPDAQQRAQAPQQTAPQQSAPQQQAVPAPQATPEAPPTVTVDPTPSVDGAPAPETTAPTQQPGITLPFGIVIPLPPAPQG
ncbi:transglycosylase protein with SLT domain [Nocardia tenerifensis]|uniref:Transglycosylase protein with SLT domain n=1 Tax=Nocardia tenerifensis TaxID=228006 RepID=A0A318KKC9_9NOCA|nr:lytic murein transglycosylase [Nocardia tenerifensis]PXX68847.1 transglycosylase protein with SLT domain [Nocardia tenerifensis]